MSDVIVAAIIGVVGALGAAIIARVPSGGKKNNEGGGQSATVNDSNNVDIKQESRQTHITNNYRYGQSSSDDDVIGPLFVVLVAFLLFVVGIGMFGRPVMWGLALMDTLFVCILMVLVFHNNLTIRKWYLAAYASSAVLVWGAVYRIETSNTFKVLTKAVAEGNLGHKITAVIQAKYVGHASFLAFVAVTMSVFLTIFSGGRLIKKFYNDADWVDEKGGRECVVCLFGVVLLLVLYFGGGYLDSWIMRMSSENFVLLSE